MVAPLLVLPGWLIAALGTAGLGAGAVTMVPQISKIINDKSAKGTSWAMAGINGVGTSVLLLFCGATVTIVGTTSAAFGLGIATLTLAGVRTISGITLIAMKYYYDHKYLDNKIKLISELVRDMNLDPKKEGKILGLIGGINKSRTQSFGEKEVINKQVGELKKEAIDGLNDIIRCLDGYTDDLDEKQYKQSEKIQREIFGILFAGKHYQNAKGDVSTLISYTEKLRAVLCDVAMRTDKGDAVQLRSLSYRLHQNIENFKELHDRLNNLGAEKNERLNRNVIFRAAKRFAKETIPFAFDSELKKINREISKNMYRISEIKDDLKNVLNDLGEKRFEELNDNERGVVVEIGAFLYSEEIKIAIENGDIQLVRCDDIEKMSELIQEIRQNNLDDDNKDLQRTQLNDELNNIIVMTENELDMLLQQSNKIKKGFEFSDFYGRKEELEKIIS